MSSLTITRRNQTNYVQVVNNTFFIPSFITIHKNLKQRENLREKKIWDKTLARNFRAFKNDWVQNLPFYNNDAIVFQFFISEPIHGKINFVFYLTIFFRDFYMTLTVKQCLYE